MFNAPTGGGLIPPGQLVGLQSFALKPGLRITQQPHDVEVRPGDGVLFEVVVSGNGTFSYQWRHDGNVINGANGSTLPFVSVQGSDAGLYTVTVSNGPETAVARLPPCACST